MSISLMSGPGILKLCLTVAAFLILTALPAWNTGYAMDKEAQNNDVHQDEAGPGLCRVVFSYFVHLQPRMASNQLALWIEDTQGNYIATVFATSYTALGGYEHRPLSLPEWRKASNWERAGRDRVDAVSKATPLSGEHTAVWDCRDYQGNQVAPGRYVYKMEGNIFWENRVVWTGEIGLDHPPVKSRAEPEYIPARAFRKGILLEDVRAKFTPGHP